MKTIRVSTSSVLPNPNNPRQVFENIEELAESFGANDAHPGEPFTPPILVQDGSLYRIVDGERRFRAMKFLGIDEFTAIVADDMDEADAFAAMVATDQKQQLTDMEKSRGVQQMLLLGVDPVKVDKASGIKGAARAKKAMQIAGEKAETMSIDHLLAIEEFGGDERLLDCKEKEWQRVAGHLANERKAEQSANEFRQAIEALGGTIVDKSEVSDHSKWTKRYISRPENVELDEGCVFTIEPNEWSGRADCYMHVPAELSEGDPEKERIWSEAESMAPIMAKLNDDVDDYQAVNILTDRKAERFTARQLLTQFLKGNYTWNKERGERLNDFMEGRNLPPLPDKGLAGTAGLYQYLDSFVVKEMPKSAFRYALGGDKPWSYEVATAKKLLDKVSLAVMDGYVVPDEASDAWDLFSGAMLELDVFEGDDD